MTLDNSRCHPPVSQENPPTEAGPPETMAEAQQLAFHASQPAESQVVVAKELEIQATQVTPANKRMRLHSIAQSKGELQEVHGPSCSPTEACQDELAAVTDIPTLWGCSFHDQSSGDVSPLGQSPEEVADPQVKRMEELKQRIQLIKLELAIEHEKRQAALQKEVEQTTLLRAALQNVRAAKTALAKAQAVAKALLPSLVPCRSSTKVGLKADVKQEDPFLSSVETKSHVALTHTSHKFRAPKDPTTSMQSLKRTSEAHTSPDAIIHHDSLVHPTASGDIHYGSKCTSVHHDLEVSVSDEDGTSIPSPAALPDQGDITSSLATEVAQCHFHIAQTPASDMGYKHPTQHDIKSHPPDEVGLKSPHSSVGTVSPKDPLPADKLVRLKSMSSPHNLCIRLDADEKEECLLCMGDRLLGEKSVHEYLAVPQISQDSINQSPNNAQSPPPSRSLVIPVSHDKNVHHVDPHNPYRVPPLASKAKQSPTASPFLRTKSLLGRAVVPFLGTKSLLAMAANCMASNTCLACEVPNRYMVHCHKFYPEFLSHVDVLCDILGEYDFLQETVFDMSGYMLHEANLSSDSGYYSPPRTVPVHLDVSSGTMVPGSVLCEDTGHPEVKMPGLMLPSASTPRVSGENTANAASMSASFGQSETFIEPNSSISGNSIVIQLRKRCCLLLLNFLLKA